MATHRNSTVAETSLPKEVPGAQILGQLKGIQSSVEDSPLPQTHQRSLLYSTQFIFFRKILLRIWFLTWLSTTIYVSTS